MDDDVGCCVALLRDVDWTAFALKSSAAGAFFFGLMWVIMYAVHAQLSLFTGIVSQIIPSGDTCGLIITVGNQTRCVLGQLGCDSYQLNQAIELESDCKIYDSNKWPDPRLILAFGIVSLVLTCIAISIVVRECFLWKRKIRSAPNGDAEMTEVLVPSN